MNILLITNRYPKGPDDPASPFVPDFVNALRMLGTEVVVLTPLYGEPVKHDDPDVCRFVFGQADSDVPIGSWGLLNPRTWRAIPRFLKAGETAIDELIRRSAIDHILALWALPSGWFARRAARRWGIPYSVWCLGSDINVWARRPVFRQMTRRVLRDAATVFADGFRLAKAVRHLSGRECRFLPSFRVLNAVPPLGSVSAPRRANFLYTGRIHRRKGVFALLDAFIQAGSALRDFELMYIGDGPDLPQLRMAVRRKGVGDRVHLLGTVSAAELALHYRAAQATVIPSGSDSLPLVFAEAVQCGSPLIVYDTGDLGHFVRRFSLGRVVPCGDIAALSSALVCTKIQPLNIMKGRVAVLELLHPQRAAGRFLGEFGITWREKSVPGQRKTCEGEVPAG